MAPSLFFCSSLVLTSELSVEKHDKKKKKVCFGGSKSFFFDFHAHFIEP